MKEKISGIYCIENKINSKKYIGLGVSTQRRTNDHIRWLRKNNHYNKYLQNAWNKYGEENFKFYVILKTAKNRFVLQICEKFFIFIHQSHISKNGYNMTWGGDQPPKMSDEQKIRTSMRFRRENLSPERLKKMSEDMMGDKNPMFGKTHTPEAIAKIVAVHKGVKPKPETLEKQAFAKRDGKHSEFGKKSKNASSKYMGVCFHKATQKWQARVAHNGKRIYMDVFINEIDAARAYDKKCWEIYHELKKLNFPEDYI